MSHAPSCGDEAGAPEAGPAPLQPDAPIELKVKTLDGKTHTYAVQAGLTVAELKAMVSKDTGVAVNLQRIIFRGKVLKDATKLSEHKGVLDGGSVVHVVGRPDDAGRSSAPASADASRGTGRDSQAARNQALPVPGAGQTVMIGGVSVPLGGDGLPPQNGGDGPILNQFLQQALGSMVFGVGPGAGRAVEPTGARPRNTESAAELNHRRFSDMNAFADFGEAYLGTVSEAASNFRMRADEQQRVLQELQRRRTQELQQGQGGYRAAGANAAFSHSAANSDADRRLASAMQGSADELRAELGSQEMPRLSTAASGAQANVSSHDENSAVLAEESVPVNETIDTLQRGLEQSEAAAPEAGTVSPSDAGDAGVSERVGGGFGSAATPATEARTSTGATALALSAVGADAPSGAALVDRVSPDIETIVISSDEDVPELAPPESSPEARHGTGAAEAAEAGAGPPPQSADTDRSANELHDLVTCDGCGLSPIRGPRWKCSTCQDFDLCGVCHTQFCATGQHHIEGHAFTRVPPTPHRRINRPPIIQGTLRRNYTSTTSATAALAPDLSRLIQAILRNYDAMRPFLRELQTSLSDERDLTGLARDRTEGLAVNLAPAVRDLSALMSDLSPLLSNLQMGDQAGHAHIEMQDMRVHTPTGYRSLEAQRREQYLRRQQYLQYRQQQQQQQVSQRSQRQQQRGAEVLRRRGRSRADVGQNSLTPGGGRTGIEGNAGNRRPSSSAAARAGAGAGSAAPAASMAPRAAGPAARAVRDQIFTEGEDTSRQLDDGVIVEDVDEGDESDNDEESMPDLAVSSGSSSDQSWVPDLEELPQPAASDVGTRTSTETAFSAAGTSNASRSDVAFSYPATNPSGLAATGASPPPGQPLVIGGGMQDQPWQEAPERSGMAQLRNLRQRLESGEFLDDDPSEDEVRQVGQLDPATLQRIRQGDPAAMQQIQQMLGGGAFAGVGGPFGMGGTFSAGNMQVQMHVLAVDQNGRPVPLPFLQQPQQQQQRQENQHQGFQGAFNPFAPPTQSSQNSTQPPNVQRPMDQTHQHPIAATVSASAVQHGLTSNLHSQLQGQSPSHMHSQGSMEPSSSSTQSQALPTVHAEPRTPRGGASLDSTVGGDNGQATTAPPLAAAAVFQQLMQQIVSQTGGPPGASEQPSEPPRPPPPNPPPPPPPGSSLPVHNIPNTPAGAVPDQPGMTPVFPYVLSGGSMVQHVPGMNGGMMMMIPPGWEGRDGPSNFPNPPFDNGGGGAWELGFVEGLLLAMVDDLSRSTASGISGLLSILRGDLVRSLDSQRLQRAMLEYLQDDFLGHNYDDEALAEYAEEVAEALIDGITLQVLENDLAQEQAGDRSISGLRNRLLPGVDVDDRVRACVLKHSRLLLTLITGAPVAPTGDNPHPFARGLRRWLGCLLTEILYVLSDSFSGRRSDAELFLRNFLALRLAHGAANLSTNSRAAHAVGHQDAASIERLIGDLMHLIEAYQIETAESVD